MPSTEPADVNGRRAGASRDYTKSGNVEKKRYKPGGVRHETRNFQTRAEDRDLLGPEVYIKSGAKRGEVMPLFECT